MGTKKGRKHFGEFVIGDVLELRAQGLTHREISERLGLESKDVVKQLIARYKRKQKDLEEGIPLRKKGRPRKNTTGSLEDKDLEIERLRMEVDLLKAFLYETERWNARI